MPGQQPPEQFLQEGSSLVPSLTSQGLPAPGEQVPPLLLLLRGPPEQLQEGSATCLGAPEIQRPSPQAPVSLSSAQEPRPAAQDASRSPRLEGCRPHPRDAQGCQALEETGKDMPPDPLKGVPPLTLDFWPPELFKNNFLLFQVTKLW